MTHLHLIDIDGLAADDTHRREHALAKRWAEYFDEAAMAADAPLPEGLALVKRLIAEGNEVQYLTGRREDRRFVTTTWLLDNGYPTLPLRMRLRSDERLLPKFKVDVIQEIYDTGEHERITLWDDDPQVILAVNNAFGPGSGEHCTWYIKHPDLIHKATT